MANWKKSKFTVPAKFNAAVKKTREENEAKAKEQGQKPNSEK